MQGMQCSGLRTAYYNCRLRWLRHVGRCMVQGQAATYCHGLSLHGEGGKESAWAEFDLKEECLCWFEMRLVRMRGVGKLHVRL